MVSLITELDCSVGTVIKVRITSVDVDASRMMLDLGDDKATKTSTEAALAEMITPDSKKRLRTRRAKPFETYMAKVVGPWPYGGTSSSTSAELLLPGGTVGRLHSSELPGLEECEENSVPMEKFLTGKKGKSVEVKVICVGKPNTITKQGQEVMEQEFEVGIPIPDLVNKRLNRGN